MPRRRTVALASAAALLATGVLAAGLAVGVTQTGTGQEWVRRTLLDVLAPRVKGTLHVGRISGSFLEGVTVDSIEIRGADDSLFVAARRVRLTYDVRDLLDRRVLLRHVEIERPVIRMEQAEDGSWNFKKLFRAGGPKTPRTGPGFGDFVVADSVMVRDASFILTMPWHPADSLRGARRDSAVTYALTRQDAEIRRRGRLFTRTWRWTGATLALSHARLADPDTAGRRFVIADLDVDESDPPFLWRRVQGDVRWLGDTIWIDAPHWDLPASTGRARGKVVWGSNLPVRYDVTVVGDSVAMGDVAWVYPTLPRTGGGRMTLHIGNDPKNLRVIEYAIRDMDVRSTGSRLRGDMTYAVGGPVLAVKDVRLSAEPVDFDLLRTLAGGPFPYDWQGTITGTVRARGGPLNRFVVDEARVRYDDRHVPGAHTIGTGRGELDILFPAFTAFRGFQVEVARLDPRTIQFLNPNFPRIGGTIAGRATLDSSWLDVRFRDADLTHTDGPAAPSRVTGSGRVTWGQQFMTYDVALDAQPLSLTTLARSYPAMPFRGVVTGPIRAVGHADSLRVDATLEGAAGRMRWDGFVDTFEPSYAAHGTLSAERLDLRALLDDARAPQTTLAFTSRVDMRGSEPADLAGALGLTLARSVVDGTRVFGGAAQLAAEGGRLRVDTLDVEGTPGRLRGRGALGLTAAAATDSLRLTFDVDSLGGLRRWIAPVRADVAEAASVRPDSLDGGLRVSATLVGTLDTARTSPGLTVRARLDGEELVYGATRVRAATVKVDVADALRTAVVQGTAALDSVVAGGVVLAQADAEVSLDPAPMGGAAVTASGTAGPVRAGAWSLRAGSDSGVAIAAAGRATVAPGAQEVRVDSARLAVATGREYRLVAPATVVARTEGNAARLDSLVLRDGNGARLALGFALQDTGAVTGALALQRVPVGDLARLAGVDSSAGYRGALDFDASLAGTRAAPLVALTAAARDATLAGVDVERLALEGRYADRRLVAGLGLFRDGARLVSADATLPLDLALLPGTRRLLDDTLRGVVRADSLDLALLGALSPAVRDVSGRVRATFDLAGTWERPRFFGGLTLDGGAATLAPAGVRLQALAADVALSGDSVAVRRVFARSGGVGDTVSLSGFVRLTSLDNPTLALRLAARNFLAVDRPRLATLWISTPTPVTVSGPYLSATVRGAVRAERGRIYIPELIDKRILDLNEYRDVVDTTVGQNRRLIPAPSAFVENLTLDEVRLEVGNDVWLRSPETNVKLGGSLAVTRAVARGGPFGRSLGDQAQLALLGALNVERGTYRLNLGLVQPVFDVQPGTIRFFGTPDLNPTLAIQAVHTVRQARQAVNRPDVRVQVDLGGTLNQPTLKLTSGDTPPIPDTDLVSYLVTGEPASSVLGQAQGADQGAALAVRLAGSLLSGALAQRGPFDVVQVQTAGAGDGTGATDFFSASRSLLEKTRLGFSGPLGRSRRTFYTFTTGLCGLGAPTDPNSLSLFANGLGFRIEQRLTPTLSLQAGFEPGTQEQLCGGRAATTRLFQQTPTQRGFDIVRTWTF